MTPTRPTDTLAEHVDQLLDAALEQTFPASDPVAVDVPPRTEAVPVPLRR